ncbi:MAG: molybdenum cofactor biosynthesis protein MoaB [Candidatus Bipolaricaulota bacterium]|nr:molybdenum cofactor biosynthesis protein MoaB [Candidatus Bipolaricaulota bacterium]
MSHYLQCLESITCWIITVSDTRTESTDTSGKLIREQLESAGHRVTLYRIIKNDPAQITEMVEQLKSDRDAHVAIFHGGTGISRKDQTARTLKKLYDEELDGFGELFRVLSYHEIGPYALLSRASAGIIGKKLVFSLPGSEHAVRLALEKLILPVLGHAVEQL